LSPNVYILDSVALSPPEAQDVARTLGVGDVTLLRVTNLDESAASRIGSMRELRRGQTRRPDTGGVIPSRCRDRAGAPRP
jgi:hypothetical protein